MSSFAGFPELFRKLSSGRRNSTPCPPSTDNSRTSQLASSVPRSAGIAGCPLGIRVVSSDPSVVRRLVRPRLPRTNSASRSAVRSTSKGASLNGIEKVSVDALSSSPLWIFISTVVPGLWSSSVLARSDLSLISTPASSTMTSPISRPSPPELAREAGEPSGIVRIRKPATVSTSPKWPR